MHEVTFTIRGISPYSQSKVFQTKKKERETGRDHEDRAWRERAHVDDDGFMFIPPMAIKNCLADAARFLSIQIPGKGKSTYTKHIEAGVLCMEPSPVLDKKGKLIAVKDIDGEWLFLPSDGKRGGGKRVDKCFPTIKGGWSANVKIMVLDPLVTPNVLKLHLIRAGQFIGLGRFRPRNNGFYGRFNVENIQWSKLSSDIDDLDLAA